MSNRKSLINFTYSYPYEQSLIRFAKLKEKY